MRGIEYSLRKELVDDERERRRAKPVMTQSGSWRIPEPSEKPPVAAVLDTLSRSLADAFKD